jgi:argininosuccinate lyase
MMKKLFCQLQSLSESKKKVLLPGYTHMQPGNGSLLVCGLVHLLNA